MFDVSLEEVTNPAIIAKIKTLTNNNVIVKNQSTWGESHHSQVIDSRYIAAKTSSAFK